MEDLRPEDPRQMGDYQLLARIGSGGMGQVFLAQSQGGRPLAIKVIRPELAGDRGFRKRFSQEVASARAVNGLYTALVVDADTDGPAPWLATVYVPGPSLGEAVEEHGPLPVESVRTLAAGLAESLKAIHAAGIVHRDLKPSNVLLAEDGPRVIDFGIARALESSSLTASGVIVGTVAFMSPEQVQGSAVGPPSDVFSLGAVLVFAASGEGPFGTGTPSAMLYRVVHNAPDTSKVPDQLRPLIDRCLARDPADRPSTAELLADLRTARPAMNWLPPGLIRIPGQERHNLYDTAYQETETARPAQGHRGNTRTAAGSRQRVKADATEIHGDLSASAEADIPVARSRARVGNLPSLPKVTFKDEFPWPAFLWFCFFAVYAAGGTALAIVGLDRGSGILFRMVFVDIIFAFFGFAAIVMQALGGLGDAKHELFEPRTKLVIGASGVRYKWSLSRRIRFRWDDIVKIKIVSDQMVVAVGTSRAHSRDIVLCSFNYKFPRSGIRTAIASFEPSLLDRTWGHDD